MTVGGVARECSFAVSGRITGKQEVIPNQKARCRKSRLLCPLACVVAYSEKCPSRASNGVRGEHRSCTPAGLAFKCAWRQGDSGSPCRAIRTRRSHSCSQNHGATSERSAGTECENQLP